jgi:hypothetical protein
MIPGALLCPGPPAGGVAGGTLSTPCRPHEASLMLVPALFISAPSKGEIRWKPEEPDWS